VKPLAVFRCVPGRVIFHLLPRETRIHCVLSIPLEQTTPLSVRETRPWRSLYLPGSERGDKAHPCCSRSIRSAAVLPARFAPPEGENRAQPARGAGRA